MAKAKIILPNGTKAQIEGNAEEVAYLMQILDDGSSKKTTKKPKGKTTVKKKRKPKTGKKAEGPTAYIIALRDDGFFKSKRTLSDVKNKLEEQGHIYTTQHISSPLVRLVRQKEIRRLKDKKAWVYVK